MKYLLVYLLVNLFIILSDKTLSFFDIDISVPAFFNLCIYSIYLFMAVLGLRCYMGFSLVAANGGSSLVSVHRLLIAVVSLVVEHGR